MQWVEGDDTIVLTLAEGESIEIPKTTPFTLRQNYVFGHNRYVAGHNILVKTGWPDDWQREDAQAEKRVTDDDRHSAEAL